MQHKWDHVKFVTLFPPSLEFDIRDPAKTKSASVHGSSVHAGQRRVKSFWRAGMSEGGAAWLR